MATQATELTEKELIEQSGRHALEQNARTLEEFDSEALAWLAAVPIWTYNLALRAELPFRGDDPLDYLAHSGWCEFRSAFVPGEAVFRIAPPSATSFFRKTLSAFQEPARLERLQRMGLISDAASESDAPVAETENAAGQGVEETAMPANQVEFRSLGCVFRSMMQFKTGSQVELRLNSFMADEPARTLSGEVAASRGDTWSGIDTTVIIHETRDLAAALYREFNVVEARRGELCALLGDSVNWEATCLKVADRLDGIRSRGGRDFPAATVRWLKLARWLSRGPSYVARRLVRRVESLLYHKQTGEALHWVEAARVLASTLRGEMESALGLCLRRIELFYRSEIDERLLKTFLPRAEHLKPFEELMHPTADFWALHYLGLGGVGKTMLLRHINRELRKGGVSVVQVDFDNLDANYPVRRPAQLLLELADGLRLHLHNQQAEGAFNEFLSRTQTLHRELGVETASPDPLANLHSDEFLQVRGAFCDFLLTLRFPVVFILDTCEELARLQPDGFFQPAVQATFEILEGIADHFARTAPSLPNIRVIFAGRRLLALAGKDWHARGGETEERQRQFAPDSAPGSLRKTYLRLQEIRGFTRDEAMDFLTRVKAPDAESGRPPVSQALAAAILDRALDNTTACDFEWEPPRPREEEDHYSPFDLSLYADWYLEDASLAVETIASQRLNPYIEVRILQRLARGHASVLSLLPGLVLLRRLNKPRLGEISGASGPALDNLYHELCQIEWMDYQPPSEGTMATLEVDRHLRARLEAFYGAPEQTELRRRAMDQLAAWLRPKVAGLKLRDLDKDLLSAAVRLLPAAEAAKFWATLEPRVPTEADWHWAAKICDFLLGEEGDVPGALRAAVRTTFCVASLQTRGSGNLPDQWRQIGKDAALHPLPEEARILADRALAGEVVVLAGAGVAPPDTLLDSFWKSVEERPKLLQGAAIEVLVELAEGLPLERRLTLLRPVVASHWLESFWAKRWLTGFAAALVYRCHWLVGRSQDSSAIRAFGMLRRSCTATAEPLPSGVLESPEPADWRLPSSLEDHVRLRLLCLMDAAQSPSDPAPGAAQRGSFIAADDLPGWMEAALTRAPEADSLWLISKTLEILLRQRALPAAGVPAMVRQLSSAPYTPPTNWPQRMTPPFFVSLARARSQTGDPVGALDLLDAHLSLGKLDRQATVAAFRAKGEVIQQHQMKDRAGAFLHTLRGGNIEDCEDLIRQMEGMLEPPVSAPAAAAAGQPAPSPGPKASELSRGVKLLMQLVGAGLIFLLVKLGVWLFAKFSEFTNHLFHEHVALGSRWLLLLGAGLALYGVWVVFDRLLRWWRSSLAFFAGTMASAARILLQLTGESSSNRKGTPLDRFQVNARLVVRRVVSKPSVILFMELALGVYVELFRSIGRKWSTERRNQAILDRVLAPPRLLDSPWQGLMESAGSLRLGLMVPNKEESSAQTSAPGNDGVSEELAQILARCGEQLLTVAIAADPVLAALSLENGLVKLLMKDGSDHEPRIRPFRVLPAREDIMQARRWGGEPRLITSPHWEQAFVTAWREQSGPSGANIRPTRQMTIENPTEDSTPGTPACRLCHMVGSALRSKAGALFTLGEETAERSERAGLFGAEQFVRQEAGFIVVQEAPSSVGLRSRTERERTAALREFADELFRCGAWGVMLIPALPSDLARQVAARLARGLRVSGFPRFELLLSVTEEARRLIRESRPEQSENADSPLPAEQRRTIFSELAWEVTLFARSETHASLRVEPITVATQAARGRDRKKT